MKLVDKRIEKFYTIELSENQLQYIVVALGLSKMKEVKSDATHHYKFDNFQIDGLLYENLANVLQPKSVTTAKTVGKAISTSGNALIY